MKRPVFDTSVILFFAIVITLSAGTLTYKVLTVDKGCPNLEILLSTKAPLEQTPVALSLKDKGIASTLEWDFGDSSAHAFGSNANHVYAKPGEYKVTVMADGRCNASTKVSVGIDSSKHQEAVPTPVIEGPAIAYVGKPVKFKEVSGKGTSWEWMFQESGKVDATSQEATYTFASAGKKSIEVTINGPGKSKIGYLVVEVKSESAAKGGGGGGGKEEAMVPPLSENQATSMLNEVINRNKTADIFKGYLCGNLKIQVTENGEKMPFDVFCKKVYDSNKLTVIKKLTITRAPKTNCVTGMDIKSETTKRKKK
ncbi:MAG: PKD domain-containing protein [Chitinophagales bacterium]|nr:PKD domain-containing protein [Chitinophagales bacterium]